MGRILVVVANSRHWEIHGKFMVSSLQLTAQSGSQIPKTVLIIEQDTFSGSCDRFCCCFLLLLLFFFFMRRGLKVSCIYIVGLDVSLFYPEILLTYLLLSELFVLRIRSEIKLFIEFKTRYRKK